MFLAVTADTMRFRQGLLTSELRFSSRDQKRERETSYNDASMVSIWEEYSFSMRLLSSMYLRACLPA